MRQAVLVPGLVMAMACSGFGQGKPAQGESAPTPAPAFVPGEVLVRFQSQSAIGKLTTRAGADEATLKRSLEASVADLSREVGIPLRTKVVASGGELLLAIPLDDLTARLAAQVKTAPGVARVQEAGGASPGPFGPPRELRVELRDGSPQAEAAAAAAADPRKAAAIARSLGRDFEHPLTGRVTGKREVFLAVDGRALTLQLVERLRSRRDVAHAQPNYVARKMGRPLAG